MSRSLNPALDGLSHGLAAQDKRGVEASVKPALSRSLVENNVHQQDDSPERYELEDTKFRWLVLFKVPDGWRLTARVKTRHTFLLANLLPCAITITY